ncbi:MAG: hypothetical protein NT011_05440 [Kiritimatiellaeota bacterium]|nr:hypothetical protein [Kiritimatiellota bacterium]
MTRASLSSRERLLAAFRREPHDHVPFSPYISQGPWWQAPLFWRDQFERAERMLELGLDPTIEIWLPDPQPHPDVAIKTWRDTSGPDSILTKEYYTPAGVLRQKVKETEDWTSWRHGPWIPTTFGIEKRSHYGVELFDDWNVSRRVEPWVKGPEDLEKLRCILRPPDGYLLEEWRMDAQRAMEFAKKHNLLTIARRTIVGDAFQWFCDIPDFMCWMVESPEFVREFLGIFQAWARQLTRLALEVGVDMVQRRGWYELPTFWGVKYWREYLVPCIEEETNLVHEAGKLHSYLLPEGQGAYAEVLKKMRVDVLQGVDPRMLHGGDLKTLFDVLGKTKSFWGGVNAEVTLNSQDPAQIAQAVREAIEALDKNNGFVLSAFIFPEVPQPGIHHMIAAWKEYCKQ